VDDELAFHFAMRVEEFEREGMSRQEAEAAARDRFGNVDSVRHECVDLSQRRQARRHRRFHMDALRQDIKFALRTMAGNRLFAAAIVLTMALGIAANTVVFSVAYGVLLRPLPFRDADRLVRLWSKNDERQLEFFSISPADYASWRAQNRVFSQIGAFDRQRDAILTRGGEPQSVEVAAVSPDVFAVLGAGAERGRTLLADDARQGAPAVAVISYYLWNSRFGADSALVGSEILLNGRRVTVAGVMPRRFFIPGTSAEIWMPLTLAGASDDHSFRFLRVLGRLAPGVEVDRARRELDMIAGRLAQESPVTNKGWSVNIVPITEWLAGAQFRRALFVLLGVVGAVLLIACANAANLQLARAAARRREIALRAALGATRTRVVTQLLTESALLAVIGGAVGLALARAGLGVLRSMGAETIPRLEDVRMDAPVLAFTVLVALGGGILFGLLPALRASRPDVGEVLKESGRGTGRSAVGGTMRAALVVSQVSLSLVLLVSAGLLLRSFARLQAVPLGFSTDGVAAIPLALPEASYPDAARAWTFYEALMERLARTPNVERVAAINSPPFAGPNTGTVFLREGEPVPTRERALDADLRLITPGYLRTLGIALLRGRDVLDTDRQGSPPVILISESMAKRYWPGDDAVGRRIRIGDLQNGLMYTIVGVVADVRYQSLEEPEIRPMMYMSAFTNQRTSTTLVVRASDMGAVTAGVRRAVAELDPALPPPNVLIVRELVDQRMSTSRFVATLLSIFAGAALVLAAIGIYGVMSYLVRLRTQELGIRVALGAPVRTLVANVVGGALRLAVIGVVIGLVAALVVTRWLGSLLFGVGATDPLTFATIAVVLVVVAAVASLVPARRAARADPSIALRDG
jgi:predicted permease